VVSAEVNVAADQREVAAVPLLALRSGKSPRLEGEDRAHIAWLAETEAPLPPILVDRRTMQVIDGMHRLMAASLNGRETIDVEFFDGPPKDVFLRAVEANVAHGLPLSQPDRRAAAVRIVASHPHLSDRAIAEKVGLAARTIASIRRRSGNGLPQLNARVGRDGKVRPLDSAEGRRRAARLLAQCPDASLREVAKAAGISPATAGDVRRRLKLGQEPAGGDSDGRAPAPVLAKLLRDPSLRHNDHGRRLLHLLQNNAVGAQEWSGIVDALPPHCAVLLVQLARQYARMWLGFARELDERARVIEPWAGRRVNDQC
jgi:ParB-like chromosome segregation protein Spo0J